MNDNIIRRRLLPFLVCISVSGCFDDQKMQLTRCDFEARTAGFYSSPAGNEPGKTVNLCMMAAGYEFFYDETNKNRCTVEIMTYENPYCYKPIGWIGQQLYWIELASDDQKPKPPRY
jgi:hypothetical protein